MTPEDFLKLAETENPSSKRGRLKVFFGMCPGVGKTYSMLAEARRLIEDGRDIMVGIIETHGRADTESLTQDLPVIPPKIISYKGKSWNELNLEEILKRKPDIVLVDELAHSNIPGSFHDKRYKDVLEILQEGINVYTTLNVQHIESQVDSIEKIVGFPISETVPDSILDIADEFVLIDIIPSELLRRLREGKVYIPEKIQQAQDNFFRVENLVYLRELSLNYTAQHVDRRMPQGKERILVAISNSPHSKNLLRQAKRISIERRAELFAVFVETSRRNNPDEKMVRSNIELAKQLGAEILHVYSEDPVQGILKTSEEIEATRIVFGKSNPVGLWGLFNRSISTRLMESESSIELIAIPVEREKRKRFREVLGEYYPKSGFMDYFKIFPTLTFLTLINLALLPVVGYWTISLFYLIIVAIIGIFFSRGPTLLAAFISAMLWNFLYIPPRFTFYIEKIEDLLMFFVFMGIALIIGGLTSKLKSRETTLTLREERLNLLFQLSSGLSKVSQAKNIIQIGEECLRKLLNCKVQILQIIDSRADFSSLGLKEKAIAEWVWKHQKPAGKYTNTLNWNQFTFFPLMTTEKLLGIIILQNSKPITLELEVLINTISDQISMALERDRLSEESKQAYLLQESEKLYSLLFDSLSHELKTPLTSIRGSASALLDPSLGNNPDARKELLEGIQENALILNLLVGNLLDISRLESGNVSLKLETVDIRDLWRDTLGLLGKNCSQHTLVSKIPGSVPQLEVDRGLFCHALFNLIYNACLYSPKNSEIGFIVNSKTDESTVEMCIEDSGQGFLGDPSQLFQKFFRGEGVQKIGTGLGLSITRSIVELHKGSIRAENRKEGGARFIISLPLSGIE